MMPRRHRAHVVAAVDRRRDVVPGMDVPDHVVIHRTGKVMPGIYVRLIQRSDATPP